MFIAQKFLSFASYALISLASSIYASHEASDIFREDCAFSAKGEFDIMKSIFILYCALCPLKFFFNLPEVQTAFSHVEAA